MSETNPIELNQVPCDPLKRIKYTTGLVLGEEDFEHEQYYLMERDRLHQRALHGYGTVWGLKVSVVDRSSETSVTVSPGLAVNPKGESIYVDVEQCASLNRWVLDRKEDILKLEGLTQGENTIPVYVVLCYHECLTDSVPIPGPPCRSQDETSAPSRVKDGFKLALQMEPPSRVEEEAVRCFGEFLRMIEISDDPGKPFIERSQMEEYVRELFSGIPPVCMLPVPTSPSPSPSASPPFPFMEKLYLRSADAKDILEAIFRVWVTELRPGFISLDSCVLLGQLDIHIDVSGEEVGLSGGDAGIPVIQDDRPVLLHTRLLQEGIAILGGKNERTVGTDLTRIVGLSWDHGGNNDLSFLFHKNPEDKTIVESKKGLVVVFGKTDWQDEYMVKKGSLNDDTFQVFCDIGDGVYSDLRRIHPENMDIVPVFPDDETLREITAAPDGLDFQKAAAFFFDTDSYNVVRNRKILIVIKGDFIIGSDGRTIDAHFSGAQLPTGQSPGNRTYGMQGGRFESWFTVVPPKLDLNSATLDRLMEVNGIGRVLAERIIDYRKKHGTFKSLSDLEHIAGFNPQRIDLIKDALFVDK